MTTDKKKPKPSKPVQKPAPQAGGNGDGPPKK